MPYIRILLIFATMFLYRSVRTEGRAQEALFNDWLTYAIVVLCFDVRVLRKRSGARARKRLLLVPHPQRRRKDNTGVNRMKRRRGSEEAQQRTGQRPIATLTTSERPSSSAPSRAAIALFASL